MARDALLQLARAVVKDAPDAIARAEERVALAIMRARAVANLHGRAWVWRKAHGNEGHYADAPDAVVSDVRFKAAVDSILKRVPQLAKGWKATAKVFRKGGVAFAKAATKAVAGFVKRTLVNAPHLGLSREEAKNKMDIEGWTDAYRDTVYRTNMASAYTEGQFEQASDPDVSDMIAGWEYDATMDSDTRPNHAKADGMIAAIDDSVWDRMRPPAGYNCRCALRIITMDEAERRGLLRKGRLPPGRLPAGAHPDSGFELEPLNKTGKVLA